MQEDPLEISERNRELAFEYRNYANEFAKLKSEKAVVWLAIRKDAKTNKEADMLYDATPDGQRLIRVKYIMDGLSRQMSAEKAHLRVLDVMGA